MLMTDADLKIKLELSNQMEIINELLNELSDSIGTSDLIAAEVFKLPPVPKTIEHVNVTEIPVETLKDEIAFYEGIRSYRKLYGDEGISTKVAYRLPGYIQIRDPNRNIIKIIGLINKHKALFKSEVQKIDGPKKRHDLVHSLFPGLITKQLYRNLYVVENISYMGFFWTNKFVTYKTTKDEVIAMIKKQIPHPPKGSNPKEWESILSGEVTDIQRLPAGSELRIKRPARVSAAVNTDCEVMPQLSAHLPIIIVQNRPVSISPLMDYNASLRRCVRSDSKIGGKPIIKRLHLYLKRQ